MTAASHPCAPAPAVAVALIGLLTGCTGSAVSAPSPTSTLATSPSRPVSPAPRPPLPTASAPTSLPSSPPAQLTPVSSSPKDLGRIDVRNGSPSTKHVPVRLPPASGYTVTVGCIGRPGTMLHWSVVGTAGPASGFLFGSTTPCNGAFLTDAAMANIDRPTPARLEVSLDRGAESATIVLRPTPADSHL